MEMILLAGLGSARSSIKRSDSIILQWGAGRERGDPGRELRRQRHHPEIRLQLPSQAFFCLELSRELRFRAIGCIDQADKGLVIDRLIPASRDKGPAWWMGGSDNFNP